MTREEKQQTILELERQGYDNETIHGIINGLEDQTEYSTEYVHKTLFKKKEVCYA